MKLVKETHSQVNRSEFREDMTIAKKLIEKAWNENCKSRNNLFWSHHCNKRLEELYNSELLKENSCIPQNFLPNYHGKETPEEKEIMRNLTKKSYMPNYNYKRLDMRDN